MSNQRTQPSRILVVEDEGIVATDIEKCLEDAGFEVTGIAASADDAMREASRTLPDLVLMDVRIQGPADGIEAGRQLHQLFESLPIIYLTAHGDRDTIERAKSTGPLAFVLKPFKPLELTNAVEIALHRAQAEKEVRERERAFRSAMESIADAVLVTDAHGNIRFINRAAEQLLGWRLDLALGRPITGIVHIVPEQMGARSERFRELVSIVGAQATTDLAERYRIAARDGARSWVTVRVSRVARPDGSPICVTVLHDVTKLLDDEKLLRRQAGLIDQSYEPIFAWELASGAIAYWNQGAERLYGFSRQEAVGAVPNVLLRTVQASGEEFKTVLERTGRWSGELTQTAKDGRKILVESFMMAAEEASGRKTVLATNRDITERKRVEESLAHLAREREAHRSILERIIKDSPACIALLNGPNFAFEMVNPAYEALIPGEPITGMTVAEVWPEAAGLVIPLLQAVRDSGTAYRGEGMAIPLRRGSLLETFYFDFSYIPFPIVGSGDAQVLVVAVDVTTHKNAEQKLRSAYEELAAIYSSAPVMLLVVNEELRVEKVNDLAISFSGKQIPDSGGLRLAGALGCLNALADSQGCGYAPSCSQCPLRLAVVDTLVNGARHEAVEVWLPSVGDGEPQRCLMVSTAAIFSGPHRKALVCAQDITKLQQTARQLQAVATEKTVLLKEVHHRVKNNLAVISSLLSMQSDIHASAEVSAALAQSQRRLQSMALIHEQLYGRDHLERVDFSEYAQQLVEEAYVAFVGEHARISLELAIDPIELGLDQAVPCALILNELLSNAFKHAFPGGRKGVIRISFRESEPGRLELAIQDDGIGSPPGHGESKPKSLGLSIVRILTAQLDGAFEQELCTGTRFVLRFPSGASRPPPRSLVA